jgi:uncharacterized delta-60 repeat protein
MFKRRTFTLAVLLSLAATTHAAIEIDPRIVDLILGGSTPTHATIAAYRPNGTTRRCPDEISLKSLRPPMATHDACAPGEAQLDLLGQVRAIAAGSQSGDLDPTFGEGGRVVTDFFHAADEIVGLAVAPDGTILAAGSVFRPESAFDMAVARYSEHGELRGFATVDFHPGQRLNDQAGAMALLPDGRIVVAGHTLSDGRLNYDFAAARLMPDLTLDPTFGTDGRVSVDFFGGPDFGNALAVMPDGGIVVVGEIANASGQQDFGLVRFAPNGTLDTAFGNGGRVVTDLSPTSEAPRAAAAQDDGKIIVVGVAFNVAAGELTMVRYLPNGSLDPGFGVDGRVFLNTYSAVPSAVAVQPDGRIVVAGTVLFGTDAADFAVWRFESDGQLDTSFGASGRVFTDFGRRHDDARAVAVMSDGKIVVAGNTSIMQTSGTNDFAVARYETDGRLDPSFGTGGRAVTDFFGHDDQVNAVAIQQRGDILAGGIVSNPGNGTDDFGLARYAAAARGFLPPVSDAYVRGGVWAATNFNASRTLLAKLGISADDTRRSYMKFDIGAIDTVGRATLRLHGRVSNSSTARVRVGIYPVRNASWDEQTVTWNTKPSYGPQLGTVKVTGTTAAWVEVDVTAFVQAEQRAGRDIVSLALRATEHTSAYASFDSREAGQSAPQLIITP